MVDREAGLSSDLENTALIDEAQIVIDGGVHVSVDEGVDVQDC